MVVEIIEVKIYKSLDLATLAVPVPVQDTVVRRTHFLHAALKG